MTAPHPAKYVAPERGPHRTGDTITMIVTIYKAQASGDRPPIEDLVVRAQKAIPKTATTNGNIEIMHADAVNLICALRQTLPQGTWSQVVAEVSRTWAADQAGIISAAKWVARE